MENGEPIPRLAPGIYHKKPAPILTDAAMPFSSGEFFAILHHRFSVFSANFAGVRTFVYYLQFSECLLSHTSRSVISWPSHDSRSHGMCKATMFLPVKAGNVDEMC